MTFESVHYIRTCRACLTSNYRKSVLSDENWMEIYIFCLNIEITACNTNLTLCVKCSHILKRYAEFKKQCQQSELFWKSLLQKEVRCNLNDIESASEFVNELDVKHAENNENTHEDEIKIEDEEQSNENTHEDEIKIEDEEQSNENTHEDEVKIEYEEPEYLEEFVTTDNSLEPEDSFECETKEQVIHSKILQDSKVVTINKEKETSIKILQETINSNKTAKNFFIESCNKCGKVYKIKSCFLSHVQSCHSKRYLKRCPHKKLGDGKCIFCEYDKKNKPNRHFKGTCDKCNTVFSSKDRLIIHVKMCGNPKVNLPFCGLCDHKPESEPWDETAHLRQHYDNNDLECKLCSFTGKDFAQMISHRYVHHPIGPVGTDEYIASSSVCILCSKKDRKPRLAEYHFRKVHLKSEGGRCCHCDKKLALMKHWRNHERAHVVRGPDCPLCGRNFKLKASLRYHIKTYHSSSPLVCDFCGKIFTKIYSLQLHISRVHTNVRAVKCDHCGKMFKSEICLQEHLADVARGKRKSCPLCPKKYYDNKSLKNHMSSHSEKRPYKCEMCEKSFKNAYYLVVHTKIHRGILNFKCAECGKAFATSSQLKLHMSVHTGVKRHKCSYCDKSYHSPSMLRDHCITRHQIALTK